MFCLALARQLPASTHRNSAELSTKTCRGRAPTKAVPWSRNRHVADMFSVSPQRRCRRATFCVSRSHVSYSCRLLRGTRATSHKDSVEANSSRRVKTRFIPDSLCLLEKRGSLGGGLSGGVAESEKGGTSRGGPTAAAATDCAPTAVTFHSSANRRRLAAIPV